MRRDVDMRERGEGERRGMQKGVGIGGSMRRRKRAARASEQRSCESLAGHTLIPQADTIQAGAGVHGITELPYRATTHTWPCRAVSHGRAI